MATSTLRLNSSVSRVGVARLHWLGYVLRRLAQAIPTLLVIATLNFIVIQLAPGDAAEVLAGESGGASTQTIEETRKHFGLDKPKAVQLGLYLKDLAVLDLGYSYRNNMPVRELIMGRLWPTLLLMGTAIVLSIGFGILLGVLAAMHPRSWRDNLISLGSMIAYAIPLFWSGLMLIVVFSLKLQWFPTSGMERITAFYTGWRRVADIAYHLALPAVTLALFYMALYARLMRAAMLEQRAMDYVTTARAKGLNERQITYGHVFRNAMLPVLTMMGLQIGALLGGSIVVETVFGWPGMGLLAYESLSSRDINVLLGIFFVSACVVVVANLIFDVLTMLLDPRIEPA